jgi:hypothetical protein
MMNCRWPSIRAISWKDLASINAACSNDHYRWVENLERIRKPAFQRKEVSTLPASWSSYLERIQLAAEKIERIQQAQSFHPVLPVFAARIATIATAVIKTISFLSG